MLSKITGIDQNNYPEMLGHTCIINAPGIFKIIWSAIKGFIDPKTQEKIEVHRPLHLPLKPLLLCPVLARQTSHERTLGQRKALSCKKQLLPHSSTTVSQHTKAVPCTQGGGIMLLMGPPKRGTS